MRTPEELLKEILQFSIEERIELIGNIWDMVVDSQEEIPITQEQCEELECRIAEHERNPQEGIHWQDLKAIFQNRKSA